MKSNSKALNLICFAALFEAIIVFGSYLFGFKKLFDDQGTYDYVSGITNFVILLVLISATFYFFGLVSHRSKKGYYETPYIFERLYWASIGAFVFPVLLLILTCTFPVVHYQFGPLLGLIVASTIIFATTFLFLKYIVSFMTRDDED